MSAVFCKDIFDGIYVNVRGSYIANLYSSKTKSTNYTKNINEDENSNVKDIIDPKGEMGIFGRVEDTAYNETVTEKLERKDEGEVMSYIRLDLEEKLPFIMASFCSNLSVLDKAYRKWKGMDEQGTFSEYAIKTSEAFPLCERFVYPCIMFASSMVLMDIDEKMSDEFYEKYVSLISLINSEIPLERLSTVEKYPY